MRFSCSAAMITAALFCCSAFAEPPAQSPSPLQGPKVTDHSPPKGKGQPAFGPDSIEKKSNKGSKPAPPPSMGEFLKTLDVLRGNSTPEAARLTAEQDSKIKAAAAEFESSTRSYMDKNKAELDALRARLSPNDRNMLDQQLSRGGQIKLSKAGFGGKTAVLKGKGKQGKGGDTKGADTQPADDSAMTPAASTPSKEDAAKTRSRIVEIYAGRPKIEDAQSKILGMLSPDQLPLVDAELTKLDARNAPQHGARGARALKRRGQSPQPPSSPPKAD